MSRVVRFRRILALAFILGGGILFGISYFTNNRFATDVFIGGSGGYHTYRIPSLLVSPKGSLLAICEGRKTSKLDEGDIDLVMRRSDDDGKTWGPMSLVYEEGGSEPITIGNPCPVVDPSTGTVWLTFCRNNIDVLVMSSTDDGRTWTKPRRISETVKKPSWNWCATGPGVGIQLARGPKAGRLVIPCDHGEQVDGKRVISSHVMYSDDHGASWSLGGTVEAHTNECQLVELDNGELLINMRNHWGTEGGRPERGGKRAISRSNDGGMTWSPLSFDATLTEPVCQGSLITFPNPGNPARSLLAFSNPASTMMRRALTVRVSGDSGVTWPVDIPVDRWPSAYSCLAPLRNGRLGLLYERGRYTKITFTIVDLPRSILTTLNENPAK